MGLELKRPNQRSNVDIPYSMGGTRNYDNVGKLRSGRKPGRHRRKRLAQPLAIERLHQQAVHAGGPRRLWRNKANQMDARPESDKNICRTRRLNYSGAGTS